jgi:hypothetical protein
MGKSDLEAALWQRIRRHVDSDILAPAGVPVVEWRTGYPPIDEAAVFVFEDGVTEMTFSDNDSVDVHVSDESHDTVDQFKDGRSVHQWRHF